MAPDNESLRNRHDRAQRLLAIKLAPIPIREKSCVFLSGKKPTISDIYANAATLPVPGIPPQYQIWFILEHYNDIQAVGNQALRRNAALEGPDENCRHYRVASWNLLLAVIVASSPHPSAHYSPSAQRFIVAYVRAWIEAVSLSTSFEAREAFLHLWATGQHDLIQWGEKAKKRMCHPVTQLTSQVPAFPFPANEFWDRVAQQPEDQRAEYGPGWAVQWIAHMENEGRNKRPHVEGDEAAEAFADLEICDMPSYLSEEFFQLPHMQILMQEVNESMQLPAKDKGNEQEMWMSPVDALELVQGKKSSRKEDTVAGILAGMSFLA